MSIFYQSDSAVEMLRDSALYKSIIDILTLTTSLGVSIATYLLMDKTYFFACLPTTARRRPKITSLIRNSHRTTE